jgi:hypothetical protein
VGCRAQQLQLLVLPVLLPLLLLCFAHLFEPLLTA